jgi:hypothetical protein
MWTAYANVLSDDTAVRETALAVATQAAGCTGNCTLNGLRGERNMLGLVMEYDFTNHRHVTVTCRRRPFIIAGAYECVVPEGTPGGSGTSPSSSASSTLR